MVQRTLFKMTLCGVFCDELILALKSGVAKFHSHCWYHVRIPLQTESFPLQNSFSDDDE